MESATENELVATSARLNNALRRFGSGWALFVEAERGRGGRLSALVAFPRPLSWLVDEERRAAFEAAGSHFESVYRLTLLYLPPPEAKARASRAHAARDRRPQRRVDWREKLDAFIERDRSFSLLEGVMPEIAWLDDARR